MAKFKGADAHLRRLRKMTLGMRREAGKLVETLADTHASEMSVMITTGSAQGQSGGKHQHVRSAPGEAPNEEFGDLRRSIRIMKNGPLRASTVVDAPHAVPLEWGTSVMAERPFARPAAQKVRKDVDRLAKAAVDRVVKGGKL